MKKPYYLEIELKNYHREDYQLAIFDLLEEKALLEEYFPDFSRMLRESRTYENSFFCFWMLLEISKNAPYV